MSVKFLYQVVVLKLCTEFDGNVSAISQAILTFTFQDTMYTVAYIVLLWGSNNDAMTYQASFNRLNVSHCSIPITS